MFESVKLFLTQRHDRLMKEAQIFGEYLKKAADRTFQFVGDLGKTISIDAISNSAYQLEYRYGTHIWLYIAIRALAQKGATAPLALFNAKKERIDSPLPSAPNSMQSWMQLEELLTIYMELCGNAYLYHDRNNDKFYPLRPSRMKIVQEKGADVLGYMYYAGGAQFLTNQIGDNIFTRAQGAEGHVAEKKAWMHDNPDLIVKSASEYKELIKTIRGYHEKGIGLTEHMGADSQNYIPFEADEILHFKFMSPTNDFYGMAPLTPLLLPLETDLYARHWNRNFFKNGAVPGGIVMVPTTMTREDFLERKKEFHKEYGGVENHGKVIVLQGGTDGATYVPFPNQHRDLEFTEGLNMGRDEVLALYQVPPIVVGAQFSTGHSSSRSPGIRDIKRMFWQDTIKPKHALKASVWNRHFEYDPMQGDHFAYYYADIEDLQPDWEALGRAAAVCISRGGVTIEEARTKIYDLPAKPAKGMGRIRISTNLRPMEEMDAESEGT